MALNPELNVISYTALTTQIIFVCVALMVIYTFFKKYTTIRSTLQNRLPKRLFYSGLLFFIFTVLTIICLFFDLLFKISDIIAGFAAIILFIYGFQMFFLDLVIFLRICFIFNASKSFFALSKITLFIYKFMFILQIMFIVSVPVLYLINDKKRIAFLPVMGLIFISILLNASMTILFVYKLCKIKALAQQKDDSEFNNNIAKNSLLTLISFCSTMLTLISFTMVSRIDPNSRLVIDFSILCLSADCYTNFSAIALTFNYFNKYYDTMCGCLDKQCKSCCHLSSNIKERVNHDDYPALPPSILGLPSTTMTSVHSAESQNGVTTTTGTTTIRINEIGIDSDKTNTKQINNESEGVCAQSVPVRPVVSEDVNIDTPQSPLLETPNVDPEISYRL